MSQRTERFSISRAALAVVAASWAMVMVVGFLLTDLPNAVGRFGPVTRLDLLQFAITTGDPPLNPLDYTHPAMDSGWEYLGQRWTYLQSAAWLWAAVLLPGFAVTRILLRRVAVTALERLVLASAVGFSLLSLWVLGCGLAGRLNQPWLLFLPSLMALACLAPRRQHQAIQRQDQPASPDYPAAHGPGRWITLAVVAAMLPFFLHLLLGGMSPSSDFDVREYHLQGPREWFEAGRIGSLRHNVYTSFPFLSEMITLAAMVWRQDVREGALAGKLMLASFQFLSTLAVIGLTRRLAGGFAGFIAGLAFVSTPWVCRITIIAYAEGALTFYGVAVCLLLVVMWQQRSGFARGGLLLGGLLAGSAMASKYTGLVYVVFPTAGMVLAMGWRQLSAATGTGRRCRVLVRPMLYFAMGVLVAVGPWLAKNAILEGNPVYPLAWSVFGATDWSPQMEAKWQNAHRPDDHDLRKLPQHLWGVVVKNDWQNSFLFAFAVPGLLVVRPRAGGWMVATWSLWILMAWWVLTHRIDRFWVPVLPFVAVLAGLSWTESSTKLWRGFVLAMLGLCCVVNYAFVRTDLVGFHAGLIDLAAAQRAVIRDDMRFLNSSLPDSARVLMVGEAEVFDADFEVVYNTVFDDNIFEQWTSAEQSDAPAATRPMRTAEAIRGTLRRHGITHVYVNWSEILRYRLTYGFTAYVHPDRFRQLQNMGVLSAPRVLSSGVWDDRSAREREEILSWPGGSQLRSDNRWDVIQLYRVVPDSSAGDR